MATRATRSPSLHNVSAAWRTRSSSAASRKKGRRNGQSGRPPKWRRRVRMRSASDEHKAGASTSRSKECQMSIGEDMIQQSRAHENPNHETTKPRKHEKDEKDENPKTRTQTNFFVFSWFRGFVALHGRLFPQSHHLRPLRPGVLRLAVERAID